jgi:RNA polymerase sigma-70 factor, ECF subfamily
MLIDEHHLLQRSQKGDQQAYGVIVNHYKEQAYSIALGYVGSMDDAYDLSQDAFIKAYKHIRAFDLSKSFFNWFYQILKRICLNFIRDKKTHFNSDAVEADKLISKDLTPEEQNEQKEIQKLVWEAIGNLSVEAREIIILKEFKEMSYKEIAALLEIPEGTVMSRLYHARKALKREIEEVML